MSLGRDAGIALAVLLFVGLVRASEAPKRVVEAGRWGGEHAVVDASDSGAAFRFDCAHGSVSGRIPLDAEGRFDVAGDFVKEHGGPIRKDEVEHRLPARYRGRVQGGTMTLTIEVAGEGAPIGPLTLERGSGGHVVRCR